PCRYQLHSYAYIAACLPSRENKTGIPGNVPASQEALFRPSPRARSATITGPQMNRPSEMQPPAPCEQTCTLSCAAPCGPHAPGELLSLADALGRWGREATQGICDTGRYRCRYFTWGEGPPLLFVHGLAGGGPPVVVAAGAVSLPFGVRAPRPPPPGDVAL